MKKTKILLAVIAVLMGSASAHAQSLKDILSGVIDKVASSVTGSSSSIVGTWTYDSPDCELESSNLLAKAGGTVASSAINKKLKSAYNKVGMSGMQITFNEDGTYTSKIKNKTTSGTYTYDASNKKVTMKSSLGTSFTAYTSMGSNSLSLLFDSSKLMSGMKTITNLASKVNSTASTVNSVIGNYDGAKLGFKMKKQ